MRFSKWHAHGNVYLLFEQAELTAERAREVVGDADGIVEVVFASDDEAEVRIWNPDGSLTEMSGNATRIAAAWLAERSGARELRIRVGTRSVETRVLGDGHLEQDMGEVTVFAGEEVDGVPFTPVDVGNPHAVVVGDPEDLPRIGALLETHPRFPNRTNVQVARLEDDGTVTARVWERGVGETAASGTSAVAVAAAFVGEGTTTVRFPGGELLVRIENGRAYLTGPAERIDDWS
jgi:diaminopimelate epimerase